MADTKHMSFKEFKKFKAETETWMENYERFPIGEYSMRRLIARVEHLQQVIINASNILIDNNSMDIEHNIECHSDGLVQEYRKVATGAEKALDSLAEEVCDIVGG
ncbi:MAG: hypothetical protein KGH64_00665 [Candidatus Micrarchaeota archaeon]|nr:hypothetical protein [Candidatus Micrarchaeota archaeon]